MNFYALFLLRAVPDGRVFGLDQQTLISTGIQLLNVCILAVILGVILYKPVQEFMRKRTDRISGQLQDAGEKMAEAEKLKAMYENRLKEIDMERNIILESAKQDAAEKSSQILSEARSEAAAIRLRTEENILEEKKRLKEEARLYIIELSSHMAGRFLEQAIDVDSQDRLFDEALAELEEATWQS